MSKENKGYIFQFDGIIIIPVIIIMMCSCGSADENLKEGETNKIIADEVQVTQATIDPEKDTELTGKEAKLFIPAGAFWEQGIEVDMENTTTDLPDEVVVSNSPVRISFSQARSLQKPISLVLNIPDNQEGSLSDKVEDPDADWKLYAMMKLEGSRVDVDDYSSDEWDLVVGDIDRTARTYTLNFYSTAEHMSVVLVAVKGVQIFGLEDTQTQEKKNLEALFKNNLASEVENDFTTPWYDREWLIICKMPSPELCTQKKMEPFIKMAKTGFSSLECLVFDKASLQVGSNLFSLKSINPFNEWEDPAAIDPKIYNIFTLTHDLSDKSENYAGYYLPSTGQIVIKLNELSFVKQTFAHEVFHAVQQAYIPKLNSFYSDGDPNLNSKWFIEATAESMAVKISGVVKQTGRNWDLPLNELSESYKTWDFFKVLAGEQYYSLLSVLDPIYLSSLTSSGFYEAVNQGMVGATLNEDWNTQDPPLVHLYASKIFNLVSSGLIAKTDQISDLRLLGSTHLSDEVVLETYPMHFSFQKYFVAEEAENKFVEVFFEAGLFENGKVILHTANGISWVTEETIKIEEKEFTLIFVDTDFERDVTEINQTTVLLNLVQQGLEPVPQIGPQKRFGCQLGVCRVQVSQNGTCWANLAECTVSDMDKSVVCIRSSYKNSPLNPLYYTDIKDCGFVRDYLHAWAANNCNDPGSKCYSNNNPASVSGPVEFDNLCGEIGDQAALQRIILCAK